MKDTVENLLKNPPDQYTDSQFNICPNKIRGYIDRCGTSVNTIVDFGCGHGIKALSIALSHPDKLVVGVDITEAFSQAKVFSQKQLFTDKLPDNLQFYKISPGQSLGSLVRPDLIYSWSVLEHVEISILPSIIKDMHDSLSPQGQIFCQIAPLYFSPFGSHLREFTDLPWAHLLFSHDDYRQLIEAQENKSLSPEQRNKRRWMFKNYESLNRITAEQLECYFIEAGFKITEKKLKVVGLSPPPALSRAYKEFALTNNELIFFASKGTARAGQCFWDRIRQ